MTFWAKDLENLSDHDLRNVAETVSKMLSMRTSGASQIPGSGQLAGATDMVRRSLTTAERVQKIFQYHDDPSKIPAYMAIRTAAKNLAEVILNNSPGCADQTRALNHVRDSVMVANAAVALDGLSFH